MFMTRQSSSDSMGMLKFGLLGTGVSKLGPENSGGLGALHLWI